LSFCFNVSGGFWGWLGVVVLVLLLGALVVWSLLLLLLLILFGTADIVPSDFDSFAADFGVTITARTDEDDGGGGGGCFLA
jgi:hypothetical protein